MATLMGIIFATCFLLALKLRSQRGKEAKISPYWNAAWVPIRICCAVVITYIPAFGGAYWTWIHVHWIPAAILAVVVLAATLLLLALAYKTTSETREILKAGPTPEQLARLAFQRQMHEQAPSS